MLEVMYGVTPSANTLIRSKAPPPSRFIMLRMELSAICAESLAASTPGTGIAEPMR